MDKVRVKKADALSILKKNRAEHRDIFLEAVEGYKKQAVEMLEHHIDEIKNGKVVTVAVSIPRPVDYTKEYDCAIKMLEMSVDEEIDFNQQAFQQYIMDDWSWKRQFITSNSFYSAKAKTLVD